MSDALFSERVALELPWLFVGKKRKKIWKVALLCLFWNIRKEINAFENCESLNQMIKGSMLYLLWDWVRNYIGDGSLSMLDFTDWFGSP